MKYSIVTKTGDKGETSLIGGSRVSKNNIRVNAYGEVDELNASLGVCICFIKEKSTISTLEQIQNHLFEIGSVLATPHQSLEDKNTNQIFFQSSIVFIENKINDLESKLPQLRNFILPGGTKSASFLHLARTICRRAERSVVSLMEEESIIPAILMYINRLSDLLFLLARHENISDSVKEKIWTSTREVK